MKAAQSFARATVIGAGTMGHGIAQVCALAGLEVGLFDLAPPALESALDRIRRSLDRSVERGRLLAEDAATALARIQPSRVLEEACTEAELVIEAVPERLELKRELLAAVERAVGAEAILATNTSSLSIDDLAACLRSPWRFLGMHFFNPVPVMPLLEIVCGERTEAEVVAVAKELGRRLGKEPIVVRDSPGFASSRLGIALAMEAIRMVEQRVASAEDIDRAMELGYRHPMGPLRLTDLVGLDVRLSIAEYLSLTLGERFEPPSLLRQMVADGRLGKKTGRGFYDWGE